MVKKHYDSLINQQAKFLELMMEGRLTAGEVMKELHLAPYTLRRWMRRAKFAKEWESAIAFIGKAHRSDVAAGRGGGEKPGGETGGAAQAGADGVRAAGEEGVLSEPPGISSTPADLDSSIKPLSERERIRTLHGREAAEAFDRLVQLRLKNQTAAAAVRAGDTIEVGPPVGNASVAAADGSPPLPAPGEATVVVPKVDAQSCETVQTGGPLL